MTFFITIAARLLGTKLAGRFARPLGWLLAILSALVAAAAIYGLFVLWLRHHDAGVRADYRAELTAAAKEKQIAAERTAGANKETRDAADRADQDNLEDVTDEASRNGSSPLDALFNELR